MNENGKWTPADGRGDFNRNRTAFPLDELVPYEGKHVAWKADGTTILASGEDMEDVETKLVAMGIDPSRVVFDYIPLPDDTFAL